MAVKNIKIFRKIEAKTQINRLYNASSVRKMDIMLINAQI